jgi:hypothetical protein
LLSVLCPSIAVATSFANAPLITAEPLLRPISDSVILPDRATSPDAFTDRLRIVGTPGEFEPASFIIRSTQEIDNVRVLAAPLSSGDATIGLDNIDIRVVKRWYQAGGAWNSKYIESQQPQLVPELLLNDERLVHVDRQAMENHLRLSFPSGPRYVSITDREQVKYRVIHSPSEFPVADASELQAVTVSPHEPKQFWVTVRIPVNAKPGVYSGFLTVEAAGREQAIVRFEAEVLPFRLAESRLIYSVYYRGKLVRGGGTVSAEYKSRDQLRAELTNIREHGVLYPNVYQLNRDSNNPFQPSPQEQRELLGDYLTIREHAGLSNSVLFLVRILGRPRTSQEMSDVVAYVEDLKQSLGGYGVESLYFYGEDEAMGQALTSQRSVWEAARRSGAKFFAAIAPSEYQRVLDLIDVVVLHGPPDRAAAQRVHAFGKKILCYHNPQSGPENPLLFRRNYGVTLWQTGYDGAMIYAYQDAGGNGAIWNDFDQHPTRGHNLTYPTINGVVDTLAWEGLREGIDDVRYLETLARIVDRGRRATDAPTKAAVESAALFLDDVRAVGQTDLDDLRGQAAEHIKKLHTHLGADY